MRPLRGAWAGWAACVVVFVAAWAWAATGAALYYLKGREAAIAPAARELAADFARLQAAHEQAVGELTGMFVAGRLDYYMLSNVGDMASGTLGGTWLDAAGRLRAGDPAPELVALARARARADGTPLLLRPEPPGWRAGLDPLLGTPDGPDVPEGQVAWVATRPDGQLLILRARLGVVFGEWLYDRKLRLKLPADVTVRRLGAAEVRRLGARFVAPEPLPEAPGPLAVRAIAAARSWTWPVPTLFARTPPAFDQLAIEVDNGPGLRAVLLRQLAGLALGLLVLAAFAAALALAGRALRRELALAQARADFTAMVSHELRTPVAAIAMYAEILEHGLIDDPAKVAGYHAIIGTEAARLRRLVDDLLDLGKIERGARTYEVGPQDLGAIAAEGARLGAEAHDRLAPPAVPVAVAEGLPPAAADRAAAVQAVANLVSNALKYGGDPAEVRVEVAQDAEGPYVDVLDRGPGVPAASRQAIFDPYVRLQREDTRTQAGTGLGLALVRGYAQGQGGRVELADRPGGGARFRLRLRPAEEPPADKPRASAGKTEEPQ